MFSHCLSPFRLYFVAFQSAPRGRTAPDASSLVNASTMQTAIQRQANVAVSPAGRVLAVTDRVLLDFTDKVVASGTPVF